MFKKFQLTKKIWLAYLLLLQLIEKKFNYLGSLIGIKKETILFARYFLH